MKPYCHMGDMCLGCSPQLIEGICPDSKAGRIVAELVGALKEIHCLRPLGESSSEYSLTVEHIARAAIAKATGGDS